MSAAVHWAKLCGTGEVPDNTMAMFTVNGVDIVLIKAGGGYLALPPLCPHMKEPLLHGCFDGCFDASVPKCNRVLRQSLSETGKPRGIADAPLFVYETRVDSGSVYVNLARQLPLYGYQHITCSPEIGPDGVKALIVNLWRQGYSNEKDVACGAGDGRGPSGAAS
ncbi:MAG: Rieske 2Fe-2S domain-containing protein [Betaproteobacteria bacterium]|nr:Rieske 2Fe-2S domain-containing protein [Betaproteobacteria bacterium]MBI3936714.1 Rieske 2Fe-2S domain-containing protein [Betaproteobacteria bacterium]